MGFLGFCRLWRVEERGFKKAPSRKRGREWSSGLDGWTLLDEDDRKMTKTLGCRETLARGGRRWGF